MRALWGIIGKEILPNTATQNGAVQAFAVDLKVAVVVACRAVQPFVVPTGKKVAEEVFRAFATVFVFGIHTIRTIKIARRRPQKLALAESLLESELVFAQNRRAGVKFQRVRLLQLRRRRVETQQRQHWQGDMS